MSERDFTEKTPVTKENSNPLLGLNRRELVQQIEQLCVENWNASLKEAEVAIRRLIKKAEWEIPIVHEAYENALEAISALKKL